MAPKTDNRTCRYCRGTGWVALLRSTVPCDCLLDGDIEAVLTNAGITLSVRTRKVILCRQGIRTLRALLQTDPAELAKAKSAGPTTIGELRMVLGTLGFGDRAWT